MINTGTPIEVYHKGKAYEVVLIPLDKPIKRTLHLRKYVSKVLPISSTICQCGAVAFNEICTNTACTGYVKAD